MTLVAFPDKADQRTCQCPKLGCNVTAIQPRDIKAHLASHVEFSQATIHLGTIRYNVNKGTLSIDHREEKLDVQQGNKSKRCAGQGAATKQAKRAKPDHNALLLDQVKAQGARVDSMAEGQNSMMKLLVKNMEQFGQVVSNQTKLIDSLADSSSARLQSQTRNISLAQAEEVVRMHALFKTNAVDPLLES